MCVLLPDKNNAPTFVMPVKHLSLLAKCTLKRCLLLLLGVALFGSQYATLLDDTNAGNTNNHTVLISAATGYSHLFYKQAFVSEGVAEEDTVDDTETENSDGIQWVALFQILSFEKLTDSSPLKALLYQLDQSTHNRSEASLFVLHHCWKSFIAAY